MNWAGRLANLIDKQMISPPELDAILSQLSTNCLMSIYDSLEARNMLDPSKAAITLSTWWNKDEPDVFVLSFATSALTPSLPELLNPKEAQLHVTLWPPDKQTSTNAWTVEKFQTNYLQPRIQAHAKRVDAHQLAAAELVEADIQKTMDKVWKSMPYGFHGSKKRGS
ncbi:hypothetical protein FS749_003578 [Ceratobasidium sp. UAMH 11750]|nr:hypothetical protein FS749_003578 [Ceratobasidium sp. UAMH 11750]